MYCATRLWLAAVIVSGRAAAVLPSDQRLKRYCQPPLWNVVGAEMVATCPTRLVRVAATPSTRTPAPGGVLVNVSVEAFG